MNNQRTKVPDESLNKFLRAPKREGVCDECAGRIVQRATGFFQGVYIFCMPTCEKCDTVYFGVMNAPRVGMEEFEKN